jgi:hypothetical protein
MASLHLFLPIEHVISARTTPTRMPSSIVVARDLIYAVKLLPLVLSGQIALSRIVGHASVIAVAPIRWLQSSGKPSNNGDRVVNEISYFALF